MLFYSFLLSAVVIRPALLRTYLQIQIWLGQVMNPLNLGWQTNKHGLARITTIEAPVSQSLLMAIFGKSAKGSKSTCSCRKSGSSARQFVRAAKGIHGLMLQLKLMNKYFK
ncbi:hypothetical protein AVEN_178863-1 [Araneus ventricosus]|uniref:Secreted protein n=1 Tax=Araneus ventricosus TaxID=182803 RepID=A0A4Y2BEH0_ARAVE|nr:hypothetical protein AVEN_178863-1 [Araneus ventricosus]